MLSLWLAMYLLELALVTSPVWWFRDWLVWVLAVLVPVSSLWLGFNLRPHLAIILAVLTIWRLINLLRIAKSRINARYLLVSSRRTVFVVAAFHVLALGASIVYLSLLVGYAVQILLLAQLVFAAAVLLTTVRNVSKLKFKMPLVQVADSDLPTVTVAIPARNETSSLQECLHSVLASNYPKLEVIVLDDCSHLQTAQVIKDFAHSGVRFVQGEPPAERWLAKNQAYDKLASEATGELILFIGVDVRISRQAIGSMVGVLSARKKSMLSVLPRRRQGSPLAAIVQPMRYWWELALPRRVLNRPPVLSTCWIIDRKQLTSLGGLKAVSSTIIPERYFAKELIKTDRYSFIRSSGRLDVTTTKSLFEQTQTTLRTQYPKIQRRPENALMLALVESVFLLGPFLLLVHSLLAGTPYGVALTSCVLLIATHVVIVSVSDPANSFTAVFNLPVVILVEIYLGLTSMVKYEFGKVIWKQRNICMPVMETIPKGEFLKSGNIK